MRVYDKTQMGVPIEGRCPYLDHRVVEVAHSLPLGYLIRHGWSKWILRKAMEGRLPPEILWRRRKLGFPFPIERFLSESRPKIAELVRSARCPYTDEEALASLEPPDGMTPDWHRDARRWRLISLLLWYELFVNRNFELFERLGASRQPPTHYEFRAGFLDSCRPPGSEERQAV